LQSDQFKRRQFITLLGVAAAWPLTARAQKPAVPVIGYLSSGTPGLSTDDAGVFVQYLGGPPIPYVGRASVFLEGLAASGYIEGRNVAIEFRWAEGHYDRLPAMAADLVRRRVNVIVTPESVVTARAAKAATATIPIVFGIGADPVQLGLVASLNRPGGNLTGTTRLSSELEPKRLQLLHELVPAARTFALLVNPGNPGADALTKAVQAAARALGLSLFVLHASTDADLDAAFAMTAWLRAEGIVISSDSFFIQRSTQLAALALGRAIPAMF